MQAPRLSDGSVTLEPFLPDGVTDTYVSWLNDPEVVRYTEVRHGAHDRAGVQRYVETQLASTDAMLWRICLDGRHVGNLRASELSSPHKRAVIALLIGDKAVHGRGVGSRAIALATAYLLDRHACRKVSAGIYDCNPASIKAFAKAGFSVEARLVAHYLLDGAAVDGIAVARFADARSNR